MNYLAQSPTDERFVLNLGPQHPATHGVLRVKMVMDGEYIVEAEPVLGYIHRMHEKMAENRTWAQFMPNTGRMDYLHALAYNHGYACPSAPPPLKCRNARSSSASSPMS